VNLLDKRQCFTGIDRLLHDNVALERAITRFAEEPYLEIFRLPVKLPGKIDVLGLDVTPLGLFEGHVGKSKRLFNVRKVIENGIHGERPAPPITCVRCGTTLPAARAPILAISDAGDSRSVPIRWMETPPIAVVFLPPPPPAPPTHLASAYLEKSAYLLHGDTTGTYQSKVDALIVLSPLR
jgi:hypothetical protein